MSEHRKVILHSQHHCTIEFHPYNVDTSVLSSSVLKISTIQQQLQDNIINTQKVLVDGCRRSQPCLTHSHFDPDWLIVFSVNFLLCACFVFLFFVVFLAHSNSTRNVETGEHKIRTQIMGLIYDTITQPVFRHTQRKNMETEAADRSHCNSRLPFYPSSNSLPPCDRCGQ